MESEGDADEQYHNPPTNGGRRSILRQVRHVYRREGPGALVSKAARFLYYRVRDETISAIRWPLRRGHAVAYDSFDWYWDRTLGTSTDAAGGRSIDFDGTTAVTTDRRHGVLNVWNLREPAAPVLTDSVSVTEANHVSLDGDVAYVTQRTGPGVLHAVDVSDASVVSSVEHDGFGLTYGIDVDPTRGLAAVADRTGRVALIDVEDPSQPRVLDTVVDDTLRGASGLQFVDESLVVSAKDTARLVVFDCSRPTELSVLTSLESERLRLVDPVTYDDGNLYTAAGSPWRPGLDADVDTASVEWQFNVIGVEDPRTPSFRGQVRTDELDRCYGIALEDGYAYATSMGNDQVVVIDVSNARKPTIHDIGSGVEFRNVHDVAVADGIGVAVSTRGRLTTFDAYRR